MSIYYIMAEAAPSKDNDESKEFGGAYINIWVKSETKEAALTKAKEFIVDEGWVLVNDEEAYAVNRADYTDDPDMDAPGVLECYDEACEQGISAIFYTWPLHEELS